MMKEIKKVGCTEVTPELVVAFYISSLDCNGQEEVWGRTIVQTIGRNRFEAAKKTEYDMHLYVGLFKNYETDEEEMLDNEVLDSYSEE